MNSCLIDIISKPTIGHADLLSKSHIGREGEVRAAAHLRSYGWAPFFPGGSRGIVDILAVGKSQVICVQCKTSQKRLGPHDTRALIEFAEAIGAIPVFSNRDSNGRTHWQVYHKGAWRRLRMKWRIDSFHIGEEVLRGQPIGSESEAAVHTTKEGVKS